MGKVDYLNECMSEFKGAPIDAFNREFCALCSNRECSRSWGNMSVFDSRVKNWRSFLFENVQRSNNPSVANMNFSPIRPGIVPEINTQTFETMPSEHVTKNEEFLTHEDVPDTNQDMHDTDPSPPMENVKSVMTPKIEVITDKNFHNTSFDKPVMLQDSKEKLEEKMEQPGCVFVFDDE